MPALAPRPLRGLAHWPHCRVAVEVVTTMTSADVMWQDGSVECNIRSNDLFPVHHLDNNEFCPGDFVVDKRGSAGSRRPFLLRAWETGKWAQVRRLPCESGCSLEDWGSLLRLLLTEPGNTWALCPAVLDT